MCFRPGPTIKLRAPARGPQAGGPLPRTRVGECIGGEHALVDLSGRWAVGLVGAALARSQSRTKSRAIRSDHPCAGPGRSRSPISPFRGAAGQRVQRSAAQKENIRECSTQRFAGGRGPARPKTGWILVAASRWSGWAFADRGFHGFVEDGMTEHLARAKAASRALHRARVLRTP
jgi:hypothetical protein